MPTETPPATSGALAAIEPGKGLLINRNFALLATGQAISNIGDFFYSTTLLVWVFALTHSAAAVSGVLVAQYTPVFLLGPIAGVFADRWNRRHTMVVADLVRAAASLLPLIVPGPLRLPAIYTSVFLISAFGRFFMPAKSGVLQVIVADTQQARAASVSQATFALSFIVGPAIASPLYFVLGPVVAVLINTASYVVSALSLQMLRASREALHPYAFKKGESAAGVGPVLRELRDGFAFVIKTRTLFIVLLMAVIAMLAAGALNALDIVFVSKNLHVSTSLYGPLMAVGGTGALLGAVGAGFASKWVAPRHMLAGAVFLLGVGMVIYSFQTWYIAALIVNFIMNIPQAGIDVGFGPLMINNTPQHMMGRAQSVIETAMFAASLISVGLAGYFGQFIPVGAIFAISGIGFALAGLFGWFAIPKQAQER
jgi:predicted MFS family arabinose efflux permease